MESLEQRSLTGVTMPSSFTKGNLLPMGMDSEGNIPVMEVVHNKYLCQQCGENLRGKSVYLSPGGVGYHGGRYCNESCYRMFTED